MLVMFKASNLYLYLTFIAIATFPIYLLPSGSVQISHGLLLLAVVFMYANGHVVEMEHKELNFAAIALLLWMLCRQFFYGFQVSSIELKPALFFLFNLITMYLLFNLVAKYRYRAISIIFYGTLAAILIALMYAVLGGINLRAGSLESYRSAGSFNNPNQLGYFSICAAGILTVLWVRFGINTLLFYIGFAICLFLSVISLSKAAMLGIGLYMLVFITPSSRYRVVSYTVLIVLISYLAASDFTDYKFFDRINNMNKENDGILARGYLLIFEMDWSLVVGEGEGYSKRIPEFHREFHSTFGNILLSYGVIGLLPAVYLIWRLFAKIMNQQSIVFAIIILMPFMAYGITHNGVRATIAWLFLGTCYLAMTLPKKDADTWAIEMARKPI